MPGSWTPQEFRSDGIFFLKSIGYCQRHAEATMDEIMKGGPFELEGEIGDCPGCAAGDVEWWKRN